MVPRKSLTVVCLQFSGETGKWTGKYSTHGYVHRWPSIRGHRWGFQSCLGRWGLFEHVFLEGMMSKQRLWGEAYMLFCIYSRSRLYIALIGFVSRLCFSAVGWVEVFQALKGKGLRAGRAARAKPWGKKSTRDWAQSGSSRGSGDRQGPVHTGLSKEQTGRMITLAFIRAPWSECGDWTGGKSGKLRGEREQTR